MPFNDRPTGETAPTSPGVAFSDHGFDYTLNDYQEGLIMGRFCNVVASTIDPIGRAENMNGSATPTLGGVVKRNVVNPIEDGNTVKTFSQVDIRKTGPISVEAIAGQTPAFRAAIYAHNGNDTNAGKASTVSTGNIDAKAEFIRKITDTTWLVELK